MVQVPYQKTLSRWGPGWGHRKPFLCTGKLSCEVGASRKYLRAWRTVLLELRQRKGPRCLRTCWLLETLLTTADRAWRVSANDWVWGRVDRKGRGLVWQQTLILRRYSGACQILKLWREIIVCEFLSLILPQCFILLTANIFSWGCFKKYT